MFKKIAFVAALASIAALPLAASANSASAPLSVTATVVGNCSISIGNTIALGNYDFITNASTDDVSAADAGSVVCSNGFAPQAISFGSDAAADSPYALAMTGPGTLLVNLSAAYTPAAGGMSFSVTATAPKAQNPTVGPYSGSTTVNVDF